MKAYISSTSPRYAIWLAVFGQDWVEVLSPIAVRNGAPDDKRAFYRMDVTSLDKTQRRKVNCLPQ